MNKTSQNKPLRIAVLASGSGTNLQAIIDAIQTGTLNARIVCVISDFEHAKAIERAEKYSIPAYFISGEPYKTKLEGEAEHKYIECLKKHNAEVIALAGFLRIVKSNLLRIFRHRIINIHPSLLPSFPGVESWAQAINYGVKITGCTVHIVDEGTDTGPIIIQKPVPVLDKDTPQTLHSRIQVQEHIAYSEALQLIAERRLLIKGRYVHILPSRE